MADPIRSSYLLAKTFTSNRHILISDNCRLLTLPRIGSITMRLAADCLQSSLRFMTSAPMRSMCCCWSAAFSRASPTTIALCRCACSAKMRRQTKHCWARVSLLFRAVCFATGIQGTASHWRHFHHSRFWEERGVFYRPLEIHSYLFVNLNLIKISLRKKHIFI